MKIKKLGHCCFIAEPKTGVRIMTDPGAFSALQLQEKNINAIIITHEHQDHLHIDSLKKVLENNPNAIVITNTAVGKLLDEAGIKYTEHMGKSRIQVIQLIHCAILAILFLIQTLK